jgi:shikimate kinase
MPGSGKTTNGKALADVLDVPFDDLDEKIEIREGDKISEIFEKEGEEYFRKIEHLELIQLIGSETNCVISTGGGTPCFHGNMQLMKASGITVYLKTTLDVLLSRLEGSQHRPLLQSTELDKKLKNLLDTRAHFYEEADITIDGNDIEIERLVQLINSTKN